MARRARSAIPDNLDPLVDTLSNVVGILVIVIALTQLELGEALDRVMQLADTAASRSVDMTSTTDEEALALRREAILDRAEAEPSEAAKRAAELLADLASLTSEEADWRAADEKQAVEAFDAATVELSRAEADREALEARAEALRQVPARLVARLPDPRIERGVVSWILVRNGRVYLVDRAGLLEQGSRAIQRLLRHAHVRNVRADEFESTALYLRKRAVGLGGFRWLLEAEPRPRVILDWPAQARGILPSKLASDPEFARWIGQRSPEEDFIRFRVWTDSFEAYLEARTVIETAGFRAGWTGHEADEELELAIRFGPPTPKRERVEVD